MAMAGVACDASWQAVGASYQLFSQLLWRLCSRQQLQIKHRRRYIMHQATRSAKAKKQAPKPDLSGLGQVLENGVNSACLQTSLACGHMAV
jgi:hypothetical protein